MSLLTVQKALARIYTDSKLRDDFLANPDVVGRTLELNCTEIQQLSQLSSQEVNLFASSLKYKRLSEIRKLLPLTTKFLGKDLNKLFFAYAETYLPTKKSKHLDDAIQFANFVINNVHQRSNQSEWLLDIIRYEQVRLKKLQSQKNILCTRYKYSLDTLFGSLNTSNSTPQLERRKVIVIWFKLPVGYRWYPVTIPLTIFGNLNIRINSTKNGDISEIV